MLGFDQRSHVDFQFSTFTRELADIDVNIEKERETNRDRALEATESIRKYNKMYRDQRTKKPSLYDEGEYV